MPTPRTSRVEMPTGRSNLKHERAALDVCTRCTTTTTTITTTTITTTSCASGWRAAWHEPHFELVLPRRIHFIQYSVRAIATVVDRGLDRFAREAGNENAAYPAAGRNQAHTEAFTT